MLEIYFYPFGGDSGLEWFKIGTSIFYNPLMCLKTVGRVTGNILCLHGFLRPAYLNNKGKYSNDRKIMIVTVLRKLLWKNEA